MNLSQYNDRSIDYEKTAEEFNKNIPYKELTFTEISDYPYYEQICSNILAFYFDVIREHNLENLILKH